MIYNMILHTRTRSSFLQRTLMQQRFLMFSSRVFVQGIPADWDQNEINARFSLVGRLSAVHLVKN